MLKDKPEFWFIFIFCLFLSFFISVIHLSAKWKSSFLFYSCQPSLHAILLNLSFWGLACAITDKESKQILNYLGHKESCNFIQKNDTLDELSGIFLFEANPKVLYITQDWKICIFWSHQLIQFLVIGNAYYLGRIPSIVTSSDPIKHMWYIMRVA